MTATPTLCEYVLDIVNLARTVTLEKLAGATGAPAAEVHEAARLLAERGAVAVEGETVCCIEA